MAALSDLVFGLGSLAVGIGLIFYERYFLKKLKTRELPMSCLSQHRRLSAFGLRLSFGLRTSDFGRCSFSLRRRPGPAPRLALGLRRLCRPIRLADGQGHELGHLSLLAVIVVVLGGVASFFVYLARRSATRCSRSFRPPAAVCRTNSNSTRP